MSEQLNNYTHLKYCNISKCRRCHPNAPRLTKQEILELKEKAKLNKNKKLKQCHNKCQYCEEEVDRINDIIINQCLKQDEPKQTRKEQSEPSHKAIEQLNLTKIKIEMTNMNNFETETGDRSNQGLIKALLKVFGLNNDLQL